MPGATISGTCTTIIGALAHICNHITALRAYHRGPTARPGMGAWD